MVITFKLSGRKCFLDRIELLKIEYISKATICQSDPGLRTKADTFRRKSCLILPALEAT